MSDEKRLLLDAAKAMQISISDENCNALLEYVRILNKWNKTYNLTAIKDSAEVIKKHLIDCLAILPFITSKKLLDVGSGAGLPGIVIAIMKPDIEITLIDSVGKKCLFMDYVKTMLELKNLRVENLRVEKFKPKELFPQITSRAFAKVQKTIDLTKHLLTKDGHYILMKGSNANNDEANNVKEIIHHPIKLPFFANNRTILEIRI